MISQACRSRVSLGITPMIKKYLVVLGSYPELLFISKHATFSLGKTKITLSHEIFGTWSSSVETSLRQKLFMQLFLNTVTTENFQVETFQVEKETFFQLGISQNPEFMTFSS